MDGIRYPLEVTGKRQLATTATPAERIGSELTAFISVGKGSNPFLSRDGMVMDCPVYSAQNEATWAKVKNSIRRFFDGLALQKRARLIRMETEHRDGETAIKVEFVSLEDNRLEAIRWAP